MTEYFGISDTHFNHDNIIGFCARPFATAKEMNEAMIEAWNAHVGVKDEVFVAGDFSYGARREYHMTVEDILRYLNGTKHLILGNHDLEYKIGDVPGWATVQHYREFKMNKIRYVMSHYPMETWRNAQHGWIMLHGHSHGGMKRIIPHRFDIGVDSTQVFHPLPLSHFAELAAAQEFEPQDHHGD